MKYAQALTVGSLIAHLETLPADAPVGVMPDTYSYRGDYNHVAIASGESTAGAVLKHVTSKVGTTMTGYKGGDYTYGTDCHVFAADYGDTGPLLALMDGELVTIEHPFVW